MLVLEIVTPTHLAAEARALFADYLQFLQDTRSCGSHLPNLDEEIRTLPAHYRYRNGEVLLALVDNAPAACIAFRATTQASTYEIKRLFVRPDFRGQGLARTLITQALTHARARGFTRVILDTDASTMPAALALYRTLGFQEYAAPSGNLRFLEAPLELTSPKLPPQPPAPTPVSH